MSTPTEIKAQAIALLTLGYPCRQVERELRRQFPDARIPHFSTISRWLHKAAAVEGKAAEAYWFIVLKEAGKIVLRRVDSLENMPLLELMELSERALNMYERLRPLRV